MLFEAKVTRSRVVIDPVSHCSLTRKSGTVPLPLMYDASDRSGVIRDARFLIESAGESPSRVYRLTEGYP